MLSRGHSPKNASTSYPFVWTTARQSSLAAQLSDVRRQQFHRFLFGSQTSSVFRCRLLVYRILVTIACRIGTPETSGILGNWDYCVTYAARRRRICLKPGVIWYRVADETHNADGRHISYLERNPQNDRRFRACDEMADDGLAGGRR
jgi:hypothetical protein